MAIGTRILCVEEGVTFRLIDFVLLVMLWASRGCNALVLLGGVTAVMDTLALVSMWA